MLNFWINTPEQDNLLLQSTLGKTDLNFQTENKTYNYVR